MTSPNLLMLKNLLDTQLTDLMQDVMHSHISFDTGLLNKYPVLLMPKDKFGAPQGAACPNHRDFWRTNRLWSKVFPIRVSGFIGSISVLLTLPLRVCTLRCPNCKDFYHGVYLEVTSLDILP